MKTNEPSDRETLRQAWIEVLLDALTPQDHEDRIHRLMKRIDSPSESATCVASVSHANKRTIRWLPLAIAATLLTAASIGYQLIGAPSPASAAVARSLDVISQDVPRKYGLTFHLSDPQNNNAIRNELFVRGLDQFAIRRIGIEQEAWLGRSGADTYWIAPPFGPVLKGDGNAFHQWLAARWGKLKLPRSPRNTPFLHVASALEIMSQRCRLTDLPDDKVVLDDGRRLVCRHIHGVPTLGKLENPPSSIDLWVSRELGIPIKVVAKWIPDERETEGGSISDIVLLYQSQPTLTQNWFTAEAHRDGTREVKKIE